MIAILEDTEPAKYAIHTAANEQARAEYTNDKTRISGNVEVYTADFMKNQQLPRYVGLSCIRQSCCLLAVH